jgi:hypothetical protein
MFYDDFLYGFTRDFLSFRMGRMVSTLFGYPVCVFFYPPLILVFLGMGKGIGFFWFHVLCFVAR